MWFNWSPRFFHHRIGGHRVTWKPYNLFGRDGIAWGVGVLQINGQHLAYVGRNYAGQFTTYLAFRRISGGAGRHDPT